MSFNKLVGVSREPSKRNWRSATPQIRMAPGPLCICRRERFGVSPPRCGAEIPLIRSFWLNISSGPKRALRYRIERSNDDARPNVEFEIFEPVSEKEVASPTVSRAKATCLACGATLAPESVRSRLRQQGGGGDVVLNSEGERLGGARLVAIVTLRPGEKGRHPRIATNRDYEVLLTVFAGRGDPA